MSNHSREEHYRRCVTEALASVLGKPSREGVLERTLQAVRLCLEADHALIMQVERVGERMTVIAEDGAPDEKAPHGYMQPLSKGMIGKCARSGQLQIADDISTRNDYTVIHKRSTRSELCVPLTAPDRVLGVLDLQSRRIAAFGHEMLSALEVVADFLTLLLERSRLARLLGTSQHALNAVLDATDSGIIVVDEAGLIRAVNDRFARWFDLEQSQLVGCDYRSSLSPLAKRFLDGEVFLDQLDRLDSGVGSPHRSELAVSAPSGRRHYRVFTAPVKPGFGELNAMLQTYVDVSALRQTQEDLEIVVRAGQIIKRHLDPEDILGELGPALDCRYGLRGMAVLTPSPVEVTQWGAQAQEWMTPDLLSLEQSLLQPRLEPTVWNCISGNQQLCDEGIMRVMTQHRLSALAHFPLWSKDRWLGSWLLASSENVFSEGDLSVLASISAHLAGALNCICLYKQSKEMYHSTIRVLAATVDARDRYTMSHSVNVSRYARMMAQAMGMPQAEVQRVEEAGLVHDVGKVSIPDSILNKPGRLTTAERAIMVTHSSAGADILERSVSLAHLAPLVRYHHERNQGGGYPAGLSGTDIPLGAAILAVADAFDAMLSFRVYRPALSLTEVMAELRRCSPQQFNPEVVATLIHLLEQASVENQEWVRALSGPPQASSRDTVKPQSVVVPPGNEVLDPLETGILLQIINDQDSPHEPALLLERIKYLLSREIKVNSASLVAQHEADEQQRMTASGDY